jgi:hypothetical protein
VTTLGVAAARASVKILARMRRTRCKRISSVAVALGAVEAWYFRQKRISSIAATEDSGRGDGYAPNDGSSPIDGGGLKIWRKRIRSHLID